MIKIVFLDCKVLKNVNNYILLKFNFEILPDFKILLFLLGM